MFRAFVAGSSISAVFTRAVNDTSSMYWPVLCGLFGATHPAIPNRTAAANIHEPTVRTRYLRGSSYPTGTEQHACHQYRANNRAMGCQIDGAASPTLLQAPCRTYARRIIRFDVRHPNEAANAHDVWCRVLS